MVSQGEEMFYVSVFFGEDVGKVDFTVDVLYCHQALLYTFSYCVFAHLNMSESFCRHFLRPFDARLIVVVNLDGVIYKQVFEADIL